jgi:SAM-dependent methyltransferase
VTVPPPQPDQYQPVAEWFEAHAAVSPWNARYDRPAVLALLGDVRGRRVLDLGCGPGLYAEALLAAGAEVVGCDASSRMVELARQRSGGAADLRVHDLEAPLDWLGDASVDLAVSALVHHDVTDRIGLLLEVRRVLRPGGALVLSTTHPTDDWLRLGGSYFEVAPFVERWRIGWDVTAWRLPLSQLVDEFADAGFVVERLVEPQPDDSLAESHPEVHEQLSTRPGFVAFRLLVHPGAERLG